MIKKLGGEGEPRSDGELVEVIKAVEAAIMEIDFSTQVHSLTIHFPAIREFLTELAQYRDGGQG